MKPETLLAALATGALLAACTTPTELKIEPEQVVLEGANSSLQLKAVVLDQDGNPIQDDFAVVWLPSDTSLIKVTQEGQVTGVASGEARVEAEVVGTELKANVPVRIKIASDIRLSHERLRLWLGQEKDNVWAEVLSEKGAFIEGYLPTWRSEDPEIVTAEAIEDPKRRQSWVKLVGVKPGTTYIFAEFQGISQKIRVAVFDEDVEYAADGTVIPKDAKKDEKKE